MTLSNTPLRMLVKSYTNGLLSRRQYLHVRKKLLRKLAESGTLTDDDLERFLNLDDAIDAPRAYKKYSSSDWLIIVLGLLAASAMGWVLYS